MKKYPRFSVLLILLLSISLLSSCSGKAKSEKAIAKEISEQNNCFQTYALKLDNYKISKRQTNKDEKTDNIWIEVNGSNDDFEYSAEYQIQYVLYNDGWLLEDYELLNSNYNVITPFDASATENELSKRFDNLTQIDRKDKGNETYLTYIGEETHELYTTRYEINVNAKFSPAAWDVDKSDVTPVERDFNLVGEWLYTDDEGRYYYMHISEVNGDNIKVNYLFANTAKTDEWNYLSSNGYQDITLYVFSNEYLGVCEDNLYFSLSDKNLKPVATGGDVNFVFLWLEDTLFVDGNTYSGFTINKKYMTRMNDSPSPLIGMQNIEMESPVEIDVEKLSDKDRIIFELNSGNIAEAESFISSLSEKSKDVKALETELNQFKETYNVYLGTWVKDSKYEDEFTISCRYDDKIILCMDFGNTIEGERRTFDLTKTDNKNHELIFHSERFDPTTYHYVSYNDYRDKLHYYWETTNNLSTLGSYYIKTK